MSFLASYRSYSIQTIIRLMLIISLTTLLAVSFCGCSDNPEQPEKAEQENMETVSIYGDESLGIDAGVDEALRDYRCVLLAGIDNGNRADIQIILCMNEESGDIKMFSVTRDTYMQILNGEVISIDGRDYEFCKCNRAYERGDKYALMQELNRHLDLNIREFIGINWECAAKFIDYLGGIEVMIEEPMLDWINQGGGLPEEVQASGDFKISEAGTQTLNGWQTVQYLRVRKYKGGDVRVREKHNREVLEKLMVKAQSMSAEEIAEIYGEIAGDLDTNMSRSTLTDTIASIASSNIENTSAWPYHFDIKYDQDKHFNYFVPNTLVSNVKELHANIFGQEEYLPSTTVQELNDRIVDLSENHLK